MMMSEHPKLLCPGRPPPPVRSLTVTELQLVLAMARNLSSAKIDPNGAKKVPKCA